MHRIFRVKAYEQEHGPHFDEVMAHKAVSKMENEDGSRGPRNGEQKKFTIPEDRSIITDNNIGLTISTDKQDIINILRNQYDTYKARKESIAKCDEEMSKCQILLDKLTAYQEQPKEDPKIKELQNEVNELKNIIKQASQMVPQPMKSMLPENMQNVMNEVDQ